MRAGQCERDRKRKGRERENEIQGTRKREIGNYKKMRVRREG
jgi:hypothetical protein